MSFNRRNLLSSALIAGATVPTVSLARHNHGSMDGPLSNAVVSFGAWPAGGEAPVDRITTPNPGGANIHQLLPSRTTIKKGGSVNFVVAGFHVVTVYGPGTKPADINATDTIALPGAPAGLPPVINDPTNRVYRGFNPVGAPQDRVEVVQFSEVGTYLVICAFLPHFQDEMWGFVRVIP